MPTISPLRVLLVARHLDAGGVTSHLLTLARALQERGVEVAIASRGAIEEHAPTPNRLEANGIRHFEVPFPVQGRGWCSLPDAVRTQRVLLNVVEQFGPLLLHAHHRAVSPYARFIERRFGFPFIVTLHAVGIPAGWLHRQWSFWGSRTICPSQIVADFLRDAFDVSSERIRVVPHGVDASYFRLPSEEERH